MWLSFVHNIRGNIRGNKMEEFLYLRYGLGNNMEEFLYFLGTVTIFVIVGWSIVYLDDDNAEM